MAFVNYDNMIRRATLGDKPWIRLTKWNFQAKTEAGVVQFHVRPDGKILCGTIMEAWDEKGERLDERFTSMPWLGEKFTRLCLDAVVELDRLPRLADHLRYRYRGHHVELKGTAGAGEWEVTAPPSAFIQPPQPDPTSQHPAYGIF